MGLVPRAIMVEASVTSAVLWAADGAIELVD
jgi:hypothetical protein